jgi:hypothetical protein
MVNLSFVIVETCFQPFCYSAFAFLFFSYSPHFHLVFSVFFPPFRECKGKKLFFISKFYLKNFSAFFSMMISVFSFAFLFSLASAYRFCLTSFSPAFLRTSPRFRSGCKDENLFWYPEMFFNIFLTSFSTPLYYFNERPTISFAGCKGMNLFCFCKPFV